MKRSNIEKEVLNNHFGTGDRNVELRLYENGVYQFSSFHHIGHLAWGAGENWKMLGSNKTYEIIEPTPA